MIPLKIDQKKLEAICRQNGVEFLGLFGSTAREEAQKDSDIDMLVRFSPQAKISYFKFYDIEKDLAKGLGIQNTIDLVTEDALNPYMKDRVYADLKVLYGQPR